MLTGTPLLAWGWAGSPGGAPFLEDSLIVLRTVLCSKLGGLRGSPPPGSPSLSSGIRGVLPCPAEGLAGASALSRRGGGCEDRCMHPSPVRESLVTGFRPHSRTVTRKMGESLR